MSGTVVWGYFSTCMTKTSDTFITNSALFGKVYFPRLAVPISILISSLIAFVIQFIFFVGFMGYFVLRGSVLHPNWWILITQVLLILMAGLGLGLGIIISSLTTKYRDLRFLVTFGVTLLMYATPVILPISSFPQRFRWIVLANPMTPIIEIFSYAYLGGAGTVNLANLAYSFIFMLVVVFIGTIIFNRIEATFMDTI
jgi:lipopolysaccharide transport system permease protein